MKNNINQISASEFKKDFLKLVDEVKNKHSSFTITKRKVPVARVVPLENNNVKDTKSYFGCMKGTIKIKGDIVNYSSELDWEVNND
ncbi:type II toxin-antitoxin system Phd/YefM family antitoxin [Candidatus Tisiphia endosymbiont of Hybos culiciformis]|uniref:type II toxin-antitoxin system Phd/YefM family antitoxin n=1 Tax=Candidatus Tisiphia endosymbiont of Hybos culiciformis TaxID=3139331 RepID=UPI003CCB51ED